MSLAVHIASPLFSVTTTRCDRTSAHVHVQGGPDRGAAEILLAVLDGHIRSGRRYLQVDMGGATFADQPALRVLSDVHHRLLTARGTLIITAVGRTLAQVLATIDPTLLVLPVNVADDVAG